MTGWPAVPLLVMVVLAGCLGATGSGPVAGDGPPEAAWAEGRGIDESALAERHFEALRTAGSFTVERNTTVAIDGDVRPEEPRPAWYRPLSPTRVAVDLDARRFHHRSVDAAGSRGESFGSPVVEASRRKPCPSADCEWEYRHLERADPDTLIRGVDRYRRDRPVEMLAGIMDDWAFEHAGTTELDGERVHRYTANSTFDGAVHPFAERPEGTGTLLVTADGVVRRWETRFVGPARVTVDGESRTVTVIRRNVVRYDDVGETTVERPDWVDRAAAANPPPETETAGG